MASDLYLEVELESHPLFRCSGKDIYIVLPVTPWEAALGASVEVPTLEGKVEMKIPPNAQAGQQLRLKGRGLPGNPSGDQYVEIQIVAPPALTTAQREHYQNMAAEFANYNPRANLRASP